jgi:hypothetical protein
VIGGHSPKAKKESHALEDETVDHTFDDDFFLETDLEVDSETAQSFMGSQCYETYSEFERLQEDLAKQDSSTELELTFKMIEEDGLPPNPSKTWIDFAKAYLAVHPVRSVRESEIDTRSTIGSEISECSLGAPVSIDSSIGLPSMTDFELYERFEFLGNGGPRKVSRQYSSSSDANTNSHVFTEHIEDRYSYERLRFLRRKQKAALKASQMSLGGSSRDSNSTKGIKDDEVLEGSIDQGIFGAVAPTNTEEELVGNLEEKGRNLSRSQSPMPYIAYNQKDLEPCGLHHVFPFLAGDGRVTADQGGPEEGGSGCGPYWGVKDNAHTFVREIDSGSASEDSQGNRKQSNGSSELSSDGDNNKGSDQKDSGKGVSVLDESVAARADSIMLFPDGFSFTSDADQLLRTDENTQQDDIVKERNISSASVRYGFRFTAYADQLRNADEEMKGDGLVENSIFSLPAGWSFAAYRDQIYGGNIGLDRPCFDQGSSGSDNPAGDRKQSSACPMSGIPLTVYNKQLRERSEGSVSSLKGGRRGSSRFDGSKDCDRGSNGKIQTVHATRDNSLLGDADRSRIHSGYSGKSLETKAAGDQAQLGQRGPAFTIDIEPPKISNWFQSDTVFDPFGTLEEVQIFDGTNKGITMEDLNIRLVGKTAPAGMANQKKKRDAAPSEALQPRSFLPSSFRPLLPKMPSPTNFFHRSAGRPAATSTQIVTPSGAFHCSSGNGCVLATTDHPFAPSPTKRFPTTQRRSPSQISTATELSLDFGEPLQRVEQYGEKGKDEMVNKVGKPCG